MGQALSEPITRRSSLALGMARGLSSMMVTLFRGGLLLGMLLIAISGAASPWGGEDGSQLASHQSSLANNGVHSVMKRGAAEVKRKSDEKKSGSKTEKKKKKEKSVKKGKNRKGKKSKGEKGKLKKGNKKKSKKGKKRN